MDDHPVKIAIQTTDRRPDVRFARPRTLHMVATWHSAEPVLTTEAMSALPEQDDADAPTTIPSEP